MMKAMVIIGLVTVGPVLILSLALLQIQRNNKTRR